MLFHNDARIIEISFSLWGREGKKNQITSLINPETQIPPMYTRINGIDDRMVENAPTFSEFWKEHGEHFQNKVVIAHNLSFDLGMINRELMRQESPPLGNPGIDTVPVLKSLLPREKSHKLSNLASALGVSHETKHRAKDDVLALEEVLSIAMARPIESLLGELAVTFSLWGGASSHRYFRDSVMWCQRTESPLDIVITEKNEDEGLALIRKRIEKPVCSSKRVGEFEDLPKLPWLWKDIQKVVIK